MSRAVHAALFLAWGAFGVWWIWNIGVEPSADQANILWAASRFAENDFTYLHHGQYLFRYPHQLYVTAFLELFLRMVGPDNPYRVQLLRLFNLAAALWAMYVAARLYRQEFAENDTFKKNDAAIILFGGGYCSAPLFMETSPAWRWRLLRCGCSCNGSVKKAAPVGNCC